MRYKPPRLHATIISLAKSLPEHDCDSTGSQRIPISLDYLVPPANSHPSPQGIEFNASTRVDAESPQLPDFRGPAFSFMHDRSSSSQVDIAATPSITQHHPSSTSFVNSKSLDLTIISINAGGKLGSNESLAAWLALCRFRNINFDIAFVSELDFRPNKSVIYRLPGYRVLRYWPGPGSRAIAWIVRSSIMTHIRKRHWKARVGALELAYRRMAPVFIIGFHGAQGDHRQESLADVRAMWRVKPCLAECILLGDFNVDLLPGSHNDPWSDLPGRASRHAEHRDILDSLLSTIRLEVKRPTTTVGMPISSFAQQVCDSHCTRVPLGDEKERVEIPSLIDYHAISCRLETSSTSNWAISLSDHSAIVIKVLRARARPTKKSISIWQPMPNSDLTTTAVQLIRDDVDPTVLVKALQSICHDEKSRKARNADRLPLSARTFLKRADEAANTTTRRALRKLAWREMKLHIRRLSVDRTIGKVKQGRAIRKVTLLKQIEGVMLPDTSPGATPDGEPQLERDPAVWLQQVTDWFQHKWGGDDQDQLSITEDFYSRYDQVHQNYTSEQVEAAIWSTNINRLMKADGTCMLAWYHMFMAGKETMTKHINHTLSSPKRCREMYLTGRVLGKGMAQPSLKEIRAILPLPPFLTIVDVLITASLRSWISTHLPQAPGDFIGGRSGTQTTDISAAVSLSLEKGHENAINKTGCTAAQADIEKYYDSIPCRTVAMYLIRCGCPVPLAVSVVFVQ